VINTLSQYNAFIMPTTNETFGMVYIEALSAGIPIIYSKEQGIDGYFDIADIGPAVDPKSVKSIYMGIIQVIENYHSLKENVATLQKDKGLRKFEQTSIIDRYDTIIRDLVQHK
jgi:glycosyltransferase involved in cell wall biosynthesis